MTFSYTSLRESHFFLPQMAEIGQVTVLMLNLRIGQRQVKHFLKRVHRVTECLYNI